MLTAHAILSPYCIIHTGEYASCGVPTHPRRLYCGWEHLLPLPAALRVTGFADLVPVGQTRYRPRGDYWDLQGREPLLTWWPGEVLPGPPPATIAEQVAQRRDYSRSRLRFQSPDRRKEHDHAIDPELV
jgi:hypothetical protein